MNGRRRKGGGGGRKSIAGSEYIQRRSAVRVWKFETAFRGRVLPKSQRESARDGNLTGGGLEEDKKKRRGSRDFDFESSGDSNLDEYSGKKFCRAMD